MKKYYSEPEMEVTVISSADVVTLSGVGTADLYDDSMDEYSGTDLWQ